MGRKRQPSQLELALPSTPRGEAHGQTGRGVRSTVASGHERPTTPERMMEEICEPVLRRRRRVKMRREAPTKRD